MVDDQEIKKLLLRAGARDAGSADAFERLYKLTAPTLMGVAARIVRRTELAEEVLHDSFVRIWQNASSFDPLATRPVAWMVAIARNRALDTSARHEVSRTQYQEDLELFDWSEGADESEERRRSAHSLRECLERLQAAERQALVLAYQHGLSHGELAAHLRTPLGTVKSWVRRGMASLRNCMEGAA